MDSMYVSPDGTCYTVSGWDEGGRNNGFYKEGEPMGNSPETWNHNLVVNSQKAGGFECILDPLPINPNARVSNDQRVIQWGKIVGNGKTISDPAIYPHAICMGTGRYAGNLLVADWGASKQILVYDVSVNPPVIIDRVGALGGNAASYTPTYVQPIAKNSRVEFPIKEYAPGMDHPLKFWTVRGLGMDSQGRLFICTSENGTMIRCFKDVEGSWVLDWQVMGLCFIDCVFADYSTGALDVYGVQEHYRMDWSNKTPGQEWSLFGYTVNGTKYINDGRYLVDIKAGGEHAMAATIMRTIGGKRIIYTNGMTCNYLHAFRFLDGTDIAVPTTMIAQSYNMYWAGTVRMDWPPEQPFERNPGQVSFIWNDLNGDGNYTKEEYARTQYLYKFNHWIDSKGNIWDNGDPIVCREFGGFTKTGAPIYDDAHTKTYKINGIGGTSRVIYQDEEDRMVVSVGGSNRDLSGAQVHVIDNWSTGNRNARSVCGLSSPEPTAIAVADHYLFDAGYETPAKVYIHDLSTGQSVGVLVPGESVGGQMGNIDLGEGLQAYKRPNGEIVIFIENNWMANVLMFRWTPPGVTLLPEDKTPPDAVGGLAISNSADKNVLQWTPGTEQKLTYCVYRSKTPDLTAKYSEKVAHALPTPSFDDNLIEAGAKYYYRVTAVDNWGNESAPSEIKASDGSIVANHSRFVRPSSPAQSHMNFYSMQGRRIGSSMPADAIAKALKNGCYIAANNGNAKSVKAVLMVR
jgi:hypothetical protein